MAAIFRKPSSLACFFCQTRISPLPQNTRSFRCPHCGCWNRYDAHGEIMSDDPAMHDEALNHRSFARRGACRGCTLRAHADYGAGTASNDRLPTMFGKGPFCHTCQTNQTLLMNLLSSYLPSPEVSQKSPQEASLTR